MKTLIAILMTASVFANTYVLTDLVTAKTVRAYQPQTEITLHNLNLVKADIFERKVYLSAVINGEKRELVANINERVTTDTTVTYLLTGTLQNNVLAHDVCDEYEAFNYTFEAELEVKTESNARDFQITNILLVRAYSWDICHGRTETTVVPYILK